MIEDPAGLGVHSRLVHDRDAENASDRLPAEKQVARHVDRVAEREVLIDHLDALAPRIRGRGEPHVPPVEDDASRVRNERP